MYGPPDRQDLAKRLDLGAQNAQPHPDLCPYGAPKKLSSLDLGKADNRGPLEIIPCRAPWSLSSVVLGHTLPWLWQTQWSIYSRALPTHASSICLQCPLRSTTEHVNLNK